MKIVLTYTGKLPSLQAKNSHGPHGRKAVVFKMRRAFHEQLLDKWNNASPLNRYARDGFPFLEKIHGSAPSQWFTKSAGRFRFLPLVVNGKDLKLVCELTIRILRRDDPGCLLTSQGDLDNRLKALFDALSVPQANQLPDDALPRDDENPFCCLLEDDSLVTELHIHTERLLRRMRADEHIDNVEVTVEATVRSSDRSEQIFT